jgi:hypothetical protein
VVAPYQWGYLSAIRLICADYAGSILAAGMAGTSLLDIGVWRAAAQAHLGRIEEARQSVEEFLAVVRGQWEEAPADDTTIGAWALHGFPIMDQDTRKRLTEGLRRAGLPLDGPANIL